jgi:hypothetical protein
MNAYKVVIAIIFLLPLVNAQYWFQSGARGGQATQFNSGAMVNIETITNKHAISGSIAYWVGEDLQNGAFLQTGYVIENQSGRYPSYCDISGCSQYEYLSAGAPEWFYEYFPPGNNNNFLGGIGPNDSAGRNGSLNTYGFYTNGTSWYFIMDKNTTGKVDLYTNTSGYNDVVAFGELANTSNGNTNLSDVNFYNLSIYRFGRFVPAPTGYAYIGYGVGSLNNLPNPYGVEEINSRANAFEVGSGLQEPRNNYPLWTNSYSLTIVSQYANTSSSGEYIASRTVAINEPTYAYFGNNTRAFFTGWRGKGAGAYNGKSNSSAVLMYGNITETAGWQLQYFVNISSSQANAHGTGWYPANSTAYYSVGENTVYENASSRYVFEGWENGTSSQNGNISVTGPLKITALWIKEYFVNVSSEYGNTTGTGWYVANSIAQVSILNPYKNISGTERLAFNSWSDGNTNASHNVSVNRPQDLYASYKDQYMVNLYGVDEYGTDVNAQTFYLANSTPGRQLYLFAGQDYIVKGAVYKGLNVTVNQEIYTNSSRNIPISLPLYNLQISATDVFGNPVEVPITLTLANGTTKTVLTDKNGSSTVTVVEDVPYGKALASTQYLGLQLSSNVQYGENVKFTVVSLTDIEIFGGIVILAFVMYFVSSRHVLRTENKYGKNSRKARNQ